MLINSSTLLSDIDVYIYINHLNELLVNCKIDYDNYQNLGNILLLFSQGLLIFTIRIAGGCLLLLGVCLARINLGVLIYMLLLGRICIIGVVWGCMFRIGLRIGFCNISGMSRNEIILIFCNKSRKT